MKNKVSSLTNTGSSSSSCSSSLSSEDKRGSLTVTIFEAYEDRRRPQQAFRTPKDSSRSRSTTVVKGFRGEEAIDKDKKFWTQPSVTVSCDETHSTTVVPHGGNSGGGGGGGRPHYPWRPVNEHPIWAWTGYYHTTNVLKILHMVSHTDNTETNVSYSHPTNTNMKHEVNNDDADDVVIDVTPSKAAGKRLPTPEIIDLSQDTKRSKRLSSSEFVLIDLT